MLLNTRGILVVGSGSSGGNECCNCFVLGGYTLVLWTLDKDDRLEINSYDKKARSYNSVVNQIYLKCKLHGWQQMKKMCRQSRNKI